MRKILKIICIALLVIGIAGSSLLIPNHVFAGEADTALAVGETKQTTEITKDGITFYFSGEQTIGKFANGDYWVLAPVTIARITPDFDGHNNGWEVNPVVEGGHGFQDGGYGGGFDPSLVPALPYTAEKTLSIVKTTPSGINRPCIKKAVVLTVVDAVPPDNGRAVFRPPYVGTDKPFYKVEDLRTNLLPSYEPVADMPALESIAKRFSSLQMDHKGGGIGRSLRPQDNMDDYQPANTASQSDAVLRLMMNDPIEDKMPALINFVQFGIDKIHTMYLGQTWPGGGGHQPGHRLVLAFAATMLDIGKAKDDLKAAAFFHGAENFTAGKNTEGLVLWATKGVNKVEETYWAYADGRNPGANKSVPDPYGYIDGGAVGSYQIITSQAHKGEMLATYLMPVLKEAWNMDEWQMISSYVDRWVYHGQWTQPDPMAPFDGNNSNYGITYGPDKKTGIPIAGTGRFISTDGAYRDGGQYRSSFVASMWDTYRNTADGAETTPPFAIISYPFSGSISMKNISCTVELKAKAYGIHGIDSVQFQVNGQNIGAPVTTTTDVYTNMYRYFWDITNVPSGTYSISAIATDKKGNTYTSMAHEMDILEHAEADMLKLIADPAPISSVANGVPKTAEALMLPDHITIVTYEGAKKANVTWDVHGCPYVPSNTDEQIFSVKGDVVLPPGVLSLESIPLKTEITVTVNAATGSDKILESIITPKTIAGIANGTAKTAEALGLPKKVMINTDGGRMQADVGWDVEKCTYDPANTVSQAFAVNGTITLPAGVVNSKGRTTKTSVNVSVYAADHTEKTLGPDDPKGPDTTGPDDPKGPDTPVIPAPDPNDGDQDGKQDDGQDGKKDPEEEDLITKDYPEMAEQLERLYERADIGNNELNPTYGAMMKREPVISLTPSLQNRLRQLAKLTFSDIAGNEWYASHIPMAVYSKLINGFPDGTFRGKTPVTCAEFLTMLARFNNTEGAIKQKAEQDSKSRAMIASLMGDGWYTDYIVVAKDGLVYQDQYTRETIVKPMTRGEVFYALANYLWREDIHEGGKYHTIAVINENPAFNDTMKTVDIADHDAEGSAAKSYNWYKEMILASENPKAGVPMDFYPAIMCLKDKGILLGSSGESKWYDPISRAEALALFERLAKVWGEDL